MIVKPKKRNDQLINLTSVQAYSVIGIEADEFRILNDTGEPLLYPAILFSIIDSQEPADWLIEFGDDGERYSYPKLLNKPGFFEDFFDGKVKAVRTFWQYINRRLGENS